MTVDENTVVATSDVTEQETHEAPAQASAPSPSEGGETADDGKQTEGEHDENSTEQRTKRLGGWQRKIARLEQENAALRAKALGAQVPQTAPATTTPETEDDQLPDPDKYETWGEYLAARDEAILNRAEKRVFDSLSKREQEKQKKTEAEKATERYLAAQQSLVEKHADLEEKAATAFDKIEEASKAQLPSTQFLAHSILHEDNGAELEYYLGSNPEEIERIAALPPQKALIEIGKLYGRLAQESAPVQETVEKPAPVPMTRAPKPPEPVKKAAATKSVDLNDPKTPLDDWMKERNRQLQNRK